MDLHPGPQYHESTDVFAEGGALAEDSASAQRGAFLRSIAVLLLHQATFLSPAVERCDRFGKTGLKVEDDKALRAPTLDDEGEIV